MLSSLPRRLFSSQVGSLPDSLIQTHRSNLYNPSLVRDQNDFKILLNLQNPLFNMDYRDAEYSPPWESYLAALKQAVFNRTNREQTGLYLQLLREVTRNQLDRERLGALCENNLANKIVSFRAQLEKYGFRLEIDWTDCRLDSSLVRIRHSQGLFLDRHLNLRQDQYEVLRGKVDLYTRKKKETRQNKIDKALNRSSQVQTDCLYYDQLLRHDLGRLESYRPGYTLLQEVLQLDSTLRFSLVRQDSRRVIYGAEPEEERWVRSYVQFEKRVNGCEETRYCVTDIDFCLGGNPLLS